VSQNTWVALKESLLRESDVSKDQDSNRSKGDIRFLCGTLQCFACVTL